MDMEVVRAHALNLYNALKAIVEREEDRYGYFAAHNCMDDLKRLQAMEALAKAEGREWVEPGWVADKKRVAEDVANRERVKKTLPDSKGMSWPTPKRRVHRIGSTIKPIQVMVLNYEDCARLLTQRRRIHNISVMMNNRSKEKNMGTKTTVNKPKTMAEVKEMYPEVLFQDQYIDLSRSGRNRLDKFLELRKQAVKLEKEMEAVKVAIALEIGAYAGADAGDHRVHFPLVEQDRVDTQRLKDEMPEIAEQFITVTSFRKFDVRVSPKSEV